MAKGAKLWVRLMRRYGWRWTGDVWLRKNGRLESRQAAIAGAQALIEELS